MAGHGSTPEPSTPPPAATAKSAQAAGGRPRYAAAQQLGTRKAQCDATAVRTAPDGTRAYVLLDGIGSTPEVRAWTVAAARSLARSAARRASAVGALTALYDRYAGEWERQDPHLSRYLPKACAVVAVSAPGRPLEVAWCGDSRAYVVTGTGAHLLTADHNLRRVYPPRAGMPGGNRNRVTSCLGSGQTDEEVRYHYRHPAIESVTHPTGEYRLLLVSDGAYEPHEDRGGNVAEFLAGPVRQAARSLVSTAVTAALRTGEAADNATALVADLT
ncbi:PP2C family protein-serine/threonine phosphatase [Kitasatospora sp. NPDC088548]|uniref:PP2C family protein-serine/threonine phosphatase n=1 Tax=Kitasatospora sp. NPDC088548 TaxID=3364075 RepID=UPI0037F369F7